MSIDWKGFDDNIKQMAKGLDCRELLVQWGHNIKIPNAPHRPVIIRCLNPEHEDKNPSLAVYANGYRCYSCEARGDVLDLIGLVDGIELFGDRVGRALEYLGTSYEAEKDAFLNNTTPVRKPPPQPKNVLAFTPRHEQASVFWRQLIMPLTLDARAQRYLHSRGLSAQLASSHNIVSVDRATWTERVGDFVQTHGRDVAQHIGILTEKGHIHPMWDHFLIIPYLYGSQIESLRFHTTETSDRYDGARYLSLYGVQNAARLPFLGSMDGQPTTTSIIPITYLVEGEIDVLSLRAMGRCVMGIPGARRWRRQWMPSGLVVNLAEGDLAAQALADDIQRHLDVHCCPVIDGKDVNEMLVDGILEAFILNLEARLL